MHRSWHHWKLRSKFVIRSERYRRAGLRWAAETINSSLGCRFRGIKAVLNTKYGEREPQVWLSSYLAANNPNTGRSVMHSSVSCTRPHSSHPSSADKWVRGSDSELKCEKLTDQVPTHGPSSADASCEREGRQLAVTHALQANSEGTQNRATGSHPNLHYDARTKPSNNVGNATKLTEATMRGKRWSPNENPGTLTYIYVLVEFCMLDEFSHFGSTLSNKASASGDGRSGRTQLFPFLVCWKVEFILIFQISHFHMFLFPVGEAAQDALIIASRKNLWLVFLQAASTAAFPGLAPVRVLRRNCESWSHPLSLILSSMFLPVSHFFDFTSFSGGIKMLIALVLFLLLLILTIAFLIFLFLPA